MEQRNDSGWYYSIVEQAHDRIQDPDFDYIDFARQNMDEFRSDNTTPDKRQEIAVQVSETLSQKMNQVDTMDTLSKYLDFKKVLDAADPTLKSFMRTCLRTGDFVAADILT